MSEKIDTSREAVNLLIHWNMQSLQTAFTLGIPIKDHPHEKCAMVLGELLDERKRLRDAMSGLLAVMPVFPTSAKNIVGLEARYDKALQEARAALAGGDNG